MNHYPQFDGTVSADTFLAALSPVTAASRGPFYVPTIATPRRGREAHHNKKQHNPIPRPLSSIHYRKGAYGVVTVVLVRAARRLTNKRAVERPQQFPLRLLCLFSIASTPTPPKKKNLQKLSFFTLLIG